MSEMLGEAGFTQRRDDTVEAHAMRVLDAFAAIGKGEVGAAVIARVLQGDNSIEVLMDMTDALEGLREGELLDLMEHYEQAMKEGVELGRTALSDAHKSVEDLGHRPAMSSGHRRESSPRQNRAEGVATQSDVGGNWRNRAVCRLADPELFFQEGNNREAKRICGGCAVRSECLTEALEDNIGYGVWGGMSDTERRAMKRRGLRR